MTLSARGLVKSFGEPAVRAVDGVSVDIRDGEFVAITGRSGSGKSTLLYLFSSLDAPTEGSVLVDGRDLSRMDNASLCRFRNREVGFVFQFHYLLGELTALENVLLPARKAKMENERRAYAADLLKRFGLKGLDARMPRHLSGGELQRVAIARALVMEPKYLFADEPTGSLDTASGETVMDILQEANQKHGTTLLMVTHDPDFAALAGRRLRLADGKLAGEEAGRVSGDPGGKA